MVDMKFQYFVVSENGIKDHGVGVIQKRRNELTPAPPFEEWPIGDWRAVATADGILINGDFGTNPPKAMILETAQVFELLVLSWRSLRDAQS